MSFHAPISEAALAALADRSSAADADTAWPNESWQVLNQAGVPGWCIPQEFGGQGLDSVTLLVGYECLAQACTTSCFILSQRDAACRRIRDGDSSSARTILLPALARGELFGTVGLSQLTTSRQHIQPALVAEARDGSFILNGSVPWVTSADRADLLILGAVLQDGRQILLVVPRESQGLSIGPPLELMALQGSRTAEVRCDNLVVSPGNLLAGPVERVMAASRGGTGGVETSCLALGLAGAAIEYLHEEARTRPDLFTHAERLEHSRRSLRNELHKLARENGTPEEAVVLRARANALVLRATQAALAASKGTGFLRHHPAQRWARQALFFLVWSCPRPAAEATLAYLSPSSDQTCP